MVFSMQSFDFPSFQLVQATSLVLSQGYSAPTQKGHWKTLKGCESVEQFIHIWSGSGGSVNLLIIKNKNGMKYKIK